tara:strand:- start:2669 stop:2800 length:132 start_codon:yes stop_codon:yes gene_type:complete
VKLDISGLKTMNLFEIYEYVHCLEKRISKLEKKVRRNEKRKKT